MHTARMPSFQVSRCGLVLERWVFRQSAWAFATTIAILTALAMAAASAGWSWQQRAEKLVAGGPGPETTEHAPPAAEAPPQPSGPLGDAQPTLAAERVLSLTRDAAARSRVLLLSTTVASVPGNGSGSLVPELTAELEGAYPAIKQWLISLQDQVPTLYVSHLDLRAPSGADTAGVKGQARLRWTAAPQHQRQGVGS